MQWLSRGNVVAQLAHVVAVDVVAKLRLFDGSVAGMLWLSYCFEFAKIFDYEIADFGTSAVNDTAGAKNDP
jgi:hypothetical protein